jgi:hypothetical protein
MHGSIAVTYAGPSKSEEGLNILVLFSTTDGGRTWRPESWVKLEQTSNFPIVAVVDSTALAPKRLDHGLATLLKLARGGKHAEIQASEFPQMSSGTALSHLNFNDATHGWTSSSDARLLSTTDGGMTWREITPSPKKTSMQAPSSPVLTGSFIGSSSGATLQSSVVPSSAATGPIAAASTISTYKSRHLGVRPLRGSSRLTSNVNVVDQQPYFDIGIYVGGSTRTCQQPNLSSRSVTNVIGQGWGLFPAPTYPPRNKPLPCLPPTALQTSNSPSLTSRIQTTYILLDKNLYLV